MKERKDYCTAEFSTWRSHSVLMSKAGVPPQCRAQQVVNCLRASVQCPKVGQSRNVECSHHITLAYTTYSLILRKTKDKKKLHHKQRIVTYTTPRNVHVGRRRRNSIQIQVFFFPFLLLPTLRHRCKNSRLTRQEAGWKVAFFRGACTILCLF